MTTYALDDQIAVLRKDAADRGWEVVGEFTDPDKSIDPSATAPGKSS